MELERRRHVEREEEQEKETKYHDIGRQLKGYPEEDVKNAKLFVSSLIKSGEEVEEVTSINSKRRFTISSPLWIFRYSRWPPYEVIGTQTACHLLTW